MKILNVHQYAYALKAGLIRGDLDVIDETVGVDWIKDNDDLSIVYLSTVLRIYPEYSLLLLTSDRLKKFVAEYQNPITHSTQLVSAIKFAPYLAEILLFEYNRVHSPLVVFEIAAIIQVAPHLATQLLWNEDNTPKHATIDNHSLSIIIEAAPHLAEQLLFDEDGELLRPITHAEALSKIIQAAPHLAETLLRQCPHLDLFSGGHYLKIANAVPHLAETLLFDPEGNPRNKYGFALEDDIQAAPQLATRLLFDNEGNRRHITMPMTTLIKIASIAPASVKKLLLTDDGKLVNNYSIRIEKESEAASIIQAYPELAEKLLFGRKTNFQRFIRSGFYIAQIIKAAPHCAQQLLFNQYGYLMFPREAAISDIVTIITAVPHLTEEFLKHPHIVGLIRTKSFSTLLPLIEAAPEFAYSHLFGGTVVDTPINHTGAGAGAGAGAGSGSTYKDDWGTYFQIAEIMPVHPALVHEPVLPALVPEPVLPACMQELDNGEDLTRILTAFARVDIDARAMLHVHEFLYLLQSPLAVMQYLAVCAQFSHDPLVEITAAIFELQQAQPYLASSMFKKIYVIDQATLTSDYQRFAYAISLKTALEESVTDNSVTTAEKQQWFVHAVMQLQYLCKHSIALYAASSRTLFEMETAAPTLGITDITISEKDTAGAFSDELSRFKTLQQQSTEPKAGAGADTLASTGFFVDPAKVSREEQARQQAAHDREFGLVVYQGPSLKK